MKVLAVLLVSCFASAYSIPTINTIFPIGPAPELTVGSLCKRPNARRYPEHIAYCERKVSSSLKDRITNLYNTRLGYHIKNRKTDYKIDHFFPLCAGGSNEADNLWPQHKSVFVLTDPLEELACSKMAVGHLLQRDALTLIRRAKLNLSEVGKILAYVRGL